jgi:hypothetical protein
MYIITIPGKVFGDETLIVLKELSYDPTIVADIYRKFGFMEVVVSKSILPTAFLSTLPFVGNTIQLTTKNLYDAFRLWVYNKSCLWVLGFVRRKVPFFEEKEKCIREYADKCMELLKGASVEKHGRFDLCSAHEDEEDGYIVFNSKKRWASIMQNITNMKTSDHTPKYIMLVRFIDSSFTQGKTCVACFYDTQWDVINHLQDIGIDITIKDFVYFQNTASTEINLSECNK